MAAKVIDIRELLFIKYRRLVDKYGWRYADLALGQHNLTRVYSFLEERRENPPVLCFWENV